MSTDRDGSKSGAKILTLQANNAVLDALKAEEEKKRAAKRNKFWKKGQSGNPAGRPKGAKGKVTLLREAVLQNAETTVLESWQDIVETTIALANSGDTTALKILWDRVIPSKRAVDINHNNQDKLNITINVAGLETKPAFPEEDIVDAEVVEDA